LFALALLALAACTTSVESNRSDAADAISVSGEGTVSASPDTAVLVVGVSVLRDTVAEAQADAGVAMDAVLDAARASGVDDDDMVTTQFSVFPEFEFSRDNERELRGFRIVNRVQITVRAIESAGDVIDAAVSAGGDDVVIDSLSFAVDDTSAMVDQAREQAVEAARSKAEKLAALSGVELGNVTSITESGGPRPPVVEFAQDRAIAADTAGFGGTPILGGEFEVSLSVFVTYTIE
jgi:uncharacterized protein YggE